MVASGGRLIPSRTRSDAPCAAAEAVLGALPVALLVIDDDGAVRDGNAAAEALLNVSRHALIGMMIVEAVGHDLHTMPAETPFVAYDLDLTLPGGRSLQADLMAAPLAEWSGWRVVTVHCRTSVASIARRTGREGGGLSARGAAAMLAHEIRNPLSGIRGAAQLLDAGCDEESRVLTRLIRDEVDRVAALLDRMDGFSDTRPLQLGPQNIHAIIEHARMVAFQPLTGGVQLREAYDPSLPPVLGHRDSLVQILVNLLKNAIEAIEQQGFLLVTTGYRHGFHMRAEDGVGRRSLPIEICVIDSGPGAPRDIAPHLFDPFVSSKRSGRGLGLAVVAKLVADMGGMVEYGREMRDGAERTVFRLLLPRATEPN